MKARIFVLSFIAISALSSCASGPNISSVIIPSSSESIAPTYSTGLAFTINENGTGYILTGIGSCLDEEIRVPDTYNGLPITSIGKEAFKESKSLKSFACGRYIETIDDQAFTGCDGLESFAMNEGLKRIGEESFAYCSELFDVYLPSSLEGIGQLAFFDSGAYRESLNLNGGASIIDNWLCGAGKLKGDYVVPDTVVGLSDQVFNNNNNLTSVDISLSVIHYGEGYLFDYCDHLTSITIKEGIDLGPYVSSRFMVDNDFADQGRIRYIRRT